MALGRLSIPGIGLDTPFYNGVHEEVLARGPGHWPGTPMVGQADPNDAASVESPVGGVTERARALVLARP